MSQDQTTSPDAAQNHTVPSIMVENSLDDIKKDLYSAYEAHDKAQTFKALGKGAVIGSALGALAFPIPYLVAGAVAAGFWLNQRHKQKESAELIDNLNDQLVEAGGSLPQLNSDKDKQEKLWQRRITDSNVVVSHFSGAVPLVIGAVLAGTPGIQFLAGMSILGVWMASGDTKASDYDYTNQNLKMKQGEDAMPWDDLVTREQQEELIVQPLSAKTLREKLQQRAQMAEQDIDGPAPLRPSM